MMTKGVFALVTIPLFSLALMDSSSIALLEREPELPAPVHSTLDHVRNDLLLAGTATGPARSNVSVSDTSGPKNCGECETIGENHRYNGGFGDWFCRLLEEESHVVDSDALTRSVFTFATRRRVVREEGADCYKCEGGDGCHSVLNVGSCGSIHPYCPVGAGDALATLELKTAIESANPARVSQLLAKRPDLFHYNESRGLVQTLDCRGW